MHWTIYRAQDIIVWSSTFRILAVSKSRDFLYSYSALPARDTVTPPNHSNDIDFLLVQLNLYSRSQLPLLQENTHTSIMEFAQIDRSELPGGGSSIQVHSRPYSPLFVMIIVTLVQLLFSRFVRHQLERHLPESHRYHSYPAEVQRRITTQPSTLIVRPLLVYYALPFLYAFVSSITYRPGFETLLSWTPEDTNRMEYLISVFASMYLFDIAHHQSSLPYFVHHYVSLFMVLLSLAFNHKSGNDSQALTLFFVPFFIPGMALGDTCGEVSWLTYRLAPYRKHGQISGYGIILRACSYGHAIARIVLWAMIAGYLWCFFPQIIRVMGWSSVPILSAALAYWGWCEWFYVKLGFRLRVKWEEESADSTRIAGLGRVGGKERR